MNRLKWLGFLLGLAITGLASATQASTVTVNAIGSTHLVDGKYGAYDELDTFFPGNDVISLNITADFTGWAALTIIAEGIDRPSTGIPYGEVDSVSFNNKELGTLNQQKESYSESFSLNPNNGGLEGYTGISTTVFAENIWVESGIDYLLKIVIDKPNWVNQIETVSLTPIPVPSTILLMGTAILGLTALSLKKRA